MMYPVLKNSNDLLSSSLNDFFNDSWFPTWLNFSNRKSTEPSVNINETENSYEIEMAVPGIKKESCKVNVTEDGSLSIKIENKSEKNEDDKGKRYIRREFSYSGYEQSFGLPEDVKKDEISAKVEDGVLKIDIPKIKKEEKKSMNKIIEVH